MFLSLTFNLVAEARGQADNLQQEMLSQLWLSKVLSILYSAGSRVHHVANHSDLGQAAGSPLPHPWGRREFLTHFAMFCSQCDRLWADLCGAYWWFLLWVGGPSRRLYLLRLPQHSGLLIPVDTSFPTLTCSKLSGRLLPGSAAVLHSRHLDVLCPWPFYAWGIFTQPQAYRHIRKVYKPNISWKGIIKKYIL